MDEPEHLGNSGDVPAPSHAGESLRDGLLNRLTPTQFTEWHREEQYAQNIENGTPYFNGTGYQPSAERHSPSKLLRCHRRQFYNDYNAPEESADPDGIFWAGSKLEEELLFPFLKQTAAELDSYVRNSIWIDYSTDSHAGPIEIKGSTDPVIVDEDATPVLPTEIKTKRTLKTLNEPNRTHRAQLHAYLLGLSEKFEIDLDVGVLIYVSRQSLDIETFRIDFDAAFWNETVLDWAATHTQYRIDEELPPATPETDWECEYCSYRERCGKGSAPAADYGVRGFVREFAGYPPEKIEEYLENNPEEELTPALAAEYPELAATYAVQHWSCNRCGSSINWKEVEAADEPLCPCCAEDDILTPLTRPDPQNIGEPND
ncbi:PD-(D/E)XK nuclease family protein [Halobacterium sp. KA-4]|uniref:CRISPR-associated protein Cas4 n=1 Tax=Halobacterium sp. KA-4 TaxID=2896367 RepID=UPI001E58900F|nr:PD-(D/E)XK nuclease family protein [Halobacterium sp. KA-4]MCD2200802.1 PD-(D/E)XK nuclease family protein [Halobacterium sp. KA-4]